MSNSRNNHVLLLLLAVVLVALFAADAVHADVVKNKADLAASLAKWEMVKPLNYCYFNATTSSDKVTELAITVRNVSATITSEAIKECATCAIEQVTTPQSTDAITFDQWYHYCDQLVEQEAADVSIALTFFGNNLLESCVATNTTTGNSVGLHMTLVMYGVDLELPCVYTMSSSSTTILGLPSTVFYIIVSSIVVVTVVLVAAVGFFVYRRIKRARSSHPYEGYEKPTSNSDDYYDNWSS